MIVMAVVLAVGFGVLGFAAENLLIKMCIRDRLGIEANGKKRWLGIGGASFQPTELVKISLIMVLAVVISRLGLGINRKKSAGFVIALALSLIHIYPRDLSAYYTEEEIASMDTEAQMEAWNKMWRNFCVSDTYEPGSTQQVFTVAEALELSLIHIYRGRLTGDFRHPLGLHGYL